MKNRSLWLQLDHCGCCCLSQLAICYYLDTHCRDLHGLAYPVELKDIELTPVLPMFRLKMSEPVLAFQAYSGVF
jgi:hypothetical protein